MPCSDNSLEFKSGTRVPHTLPVFSATYTAVVDCLTAVHRGRSNGNFMSLLNNLSKEDKCALPGAGGPYRVMKSEGTGIRLTCTVVTQNVEFLF